MVGELPGRLLVVGPHAGVHSGQLLQYGGLPRKHPGKLALAKGYRNVKVHLQCSIYGALIQVWQRESGHELCYNGCTSYSQCRSEPDSPEELRMLVYADEHALATPP